MVIEVASVGNETALIVTTSPPSAVPDTGVKEVNDGHVEIIPVLQTRVAVQETAAHQVQAGREACKQDKQLETVWPV